MSLFTSVVRDYCGNERKLVTADAANMYMYTHASPFFFLQVETKSIETDHHCPSYSVCPEQLHRHTTVSNYNITQINRFPSSAHNSISMLFTAHQYTAWIRRVKGNNIGTFAFLCGYSCFP